MVVRRELKNSRIQEFKNSRIQESGVRSQESGVRSDSAEKAYLQNVML